MARTRQDKEHERRELLRRLLEERRREIQDKLRSLLDTLPAEVTQVKDAEEQSVADFVQEVDFALMQMKSETLAKIDEALRRLDGGRYGDCAECGTPIPEARLSALPFAEYCRSCQEQHEESSHRLREQERENGFGGGLEGLS
jgi:DnaK suppressor protein